MNKKLYYFKIGLMVVIALASLVFLFTKPMITQPLDYHQFADQRHFMGIPNAQDVLSNVFFLIVGLLGIKAVAGQNFYTKKPWMWFFISIVLVAPGSAYYHWGPANSTLVWDRLPMSMGFMALYVVLLSEHISLKSERFLSLALFTGILSVVVWVVTSDLRFYIWIQFSSFITIPIILGLFPSRYNLKTWYMIALLFYGLAKWVELKDREIFFFTQQLISGHSLKHILAAAGLGALCWMVKMRKEISPAVANGSITDSSALQEKTF